jgi:hypothetical protein
VAARLTHKLQATVERLDVSGQRHGRLEGLVTRLAAERHVTTPARLLVPAEAAAELKPLAAHLTHKRFLVVVLGNMAGQVALGFEASLAHAAAVLEVTPSLVYGTDVADAVALAAELSSTLLTHYRS